MTKTKDKDYMIILISLKAFAFSHMMHEKLGSKSTHGLYTFIKSEEVKVEKVTKINLKTISKTTCTSADPGENMCKVSKRLV